MTAIANASAPARPANLVDADRRWLAALRRRYHHRRFVAPDPLQFLYRYEDDGDREVAGLVASALAYGNVKAMLPAIAGVLEPLGATPARTLATSTPRDLRRRYTRFRYRFTTAEQLAGLLIATRRVRKDHGSLDACVADSTRTAGAGAEPGSLAGLATLVDALTAASPVPLSHLLPHPRDGSACKRLNLYLRWMVRADAVDPGGWHSLLAGQLVMPLDTHVFRTACARGWTDRRTPDLKTALQITAALREIAPADPLRFDFAITRPGIRGERARSVA